MKGYVRLSEIAATTQGGKLKLTGKDFVEGGYPAYGAGGINGSVEVREFNKHAVVLSAIGARCGKCFLAEGGWTSLANTRLIFPDEERVDVRFLWYQLNDEASWPRSGAAQPFIRPTDVSNRMVFLPPLDEQQQIVAVLDEAFEGLTRARAHAEANLQNARELFDRELEAALDVLEIRYGTTQLGQVSDFRNGFAFKSERFKLAGEPIVRISNIQGGEVDIAKVVYTDPRDYVEDLSKYRVQPDDLLIAMSGATTGKVGFNTTGRVLLQNQRVGRFCPTDNLSLSYLYYVLSTRVAEHLSISAGAAQPNLSTKQIIDIQLPIPPTDVQDAFVEDIETLQAATKALEEKYLEKIQSLGALRQSLLQKAFAGELT